MLTLYVRTASSSGGTGTGDTISGATRAFPSSGEAVRSLPNPVVDNVEILCRSDGGPDLDPPTQADFDMVTAIDKTIVIKAAPGSRHAGIWNETKYHFKVTNRNGMYNNRPAHIIFEGIQGEVTVTDGQSYVVFKSSNANQIESDIDCHIRGCIAKAVRTNGAVIGFNTRWPDLTTGGFSNLPTVENNLALDCYVGYSNDVSPTNGGVPAAYHNNDAINCQFGFVDDGMMYATGNRASGCQIGFVGLSNFHPLSDNNAEDDGNGAPGSNSLSGATFLFVNAAGGNYNLAEGDPGIDTGPIAPQGMQVVDITGVTNRQVGTQVDIGCFEYNLGGGLPPDPEPEPEPDPVPEGYLRVQFIGQVALPHRMADATSLARPGQRQGYDQLPGLYSSGELAIFVEQQAQDLVTLGLVRLE